MPHARSSKSAAPAAKPNRSDLTRAPGPVEIPGQAYGDQAAQVAAQRRIPAGPPPLPAGAPAPAPAPPGNAGGSAVNAMGTPLVGSRGPLDRPTERPNEPVTHGLPMGPGAGPEALTGIGAAARQGAVEQGTLAHLLTSLAAQPGATSAIRDLASRAQAGAM